MRNVGRAHEGDAEAVAAGGGLILPLALQRKRFGIQRGVAASPENRPVRLAWIEAAEVPAPTSKSAATAAKASPTAKISAAELAALGAECLHCIAQAVHIHAGQRAYLA
jgi:hypothetical protein